VEPLHQADKMGQYYKAVFLSNDGEIIGWSESNGGVKMIEHCYIDNPFVLFIQKKIYQTPTRVVWAGDYAEAEPAKEDLESTIKALRHLINYENDVCSCDKHHVEHASKILKRNYSENFDTDDCICTTFALDFARMSLYYMCSTQREYPLMLYTYMIYCDDYEKNNKLHQYIINHTLKEYVDVHRKIENDGVSDDAPSPWDSKTPQFHPLPLLTAEVGTGGGGDYRGEGEKDIGAWARHKISTEDKVPEGFTERVVKFKEY
jgi:hypothetical protein